MKKSKLKPISILNLENILDPTPEPIVQDLPVPSIQEVLEGLFIQRDILVKEFMSKNTHLGRDSKEQLEEEIMRKLIADLSISKNYDHEVKE